MEITINQIKNPIDIFEKENHLKTPEFLNKYESGLLGDNIDFVEWSATYDMLNYARKNLIYFKIHKNN